MTSPVNDIPSTYLCNRLHLNTIEIGVLEKLQDMVVEEYVTKKERVRKTMVIIESNENSISAELQYQMIESYSIRAKIIMDPAVIRTTNEDELMDHG